jgi:hypothetical protein
MPLYLSFSAKRSPTSNNPILLCRTITKHSPSLNPLNISNPKFGYITKPNFRSKGEPIFSSEQKVTEP